MNFGNDDGDDDDYDDDNDLPSILQLTELLLFFDELRDICE